MNMSKHAKKVIVVTRKLLCCLSGNNAVGLASSTLTGTKQLSLQEIKSIASDIAAYTTNEKNTHYLWKALQFIAPHISYESIINFSML